MSQMNSISHFLPPYNLMYPYRNPYYPYYYPDHIQEQSQSSRAYKIEIIKWLQSLEPCEQYKLFQIKGQTKTFPLLQMYIYDRLYFPSCYAQKQQQSKIALGEKLDDKFIIKQKQNLHTKSEEFYRCLQIQDEETFFDLISLKEGTLQNFNQFLEILQEVTYNNFLSQIPKVQLDKVQDPEWFTKENFHCCEEWIIKEFEMNITFNYATQHDRKKKNKSHNQTTIKNNHNELNNFFQKYLANNEEKLIFYFDRITNELQQQPTLLENIFYNNIFQSSAIKIYKPQKQILVSFLNQCHSDKNILQSICITSMNELINQNTYYLKKIYPIILNLYQDHLERELFNFNYEENQQLKQQKEKKGKKKKQIHSKLKLASLQYNDISNIKQVGNKSSKLSEIKKQANNISEIERIKQIEIDLFLYTTSSLESIIQLANQSLFQENGFRNREDLDYQKITSEKKNLEIIYPHSPVSDITIDTRTAFSISNKTETLSEDENSKAFSHRSEERVISTTIKFDQHEEEKSSNLNLPQSEVELKKQFNNLSESNSLFQSSSTSCSFKSKCKIVQTEDIIDQQSENIYENKRRAKEKMFEIISINIIDFTDSILKDYDSMLQFRILVFERIKVVIQNVFFGIPDNMIKLFGSCATGLALLDSDIDIGINGFETHTKNQLKQPFNELYFALTQRKWVIKSNPIINSAVPVIKLEIDPMISFNEFDDFLNINAKQQKELRLIKQRLKSGIKVDISFSCYGNHLGYATTEIVIQWMKEYPAIQQLVLVCKTIIKKLGLAESYKGGLSSYALIVMIYSYLREKRKDSQLLGEQFIDMMYFYSAQFNPSETGIGLASLGTNINTNEPSYFFNLKDYCLPKLPITIFSPLNQRLLTGSCQHINKLFNFFRTIYEQSEQNLQFFESYVTFGKKKQQKLSKEIDDFILKVLNLVH